MEKPHIWHYGLVARSGVCVQVSTGGRVKAAINESRSEIHSDIAERKPFADAKLSAMDDVDKLRVAAVAAMRHAYRNDPDLLKGVDHIAEGATNTDLIQWMTSSSTKTCG